MNRFRSSFLIVLIAGFLIKIPFAFLPLTGHFGSYQSIVAMMAVRMQEVGLWAVLMPQTFVLEAGHPSMQLLYYPFSSLAAAVLGSIPLGDIDFWCRMQAILSMTVTIAFFALFLKKYVSRQLVLWSVLFLTLSPMGLISGISMQNESIALCFFMASLYMSTRKGFASAGIAGLLAGLTLVARIHFLVMGPVFFAIWIMRKADWKQCVFFILAMAMPLLLWFGFIWHMEQNHAEMISTSFFSQLTEGRIGKGSTLRDPHYWSRIAWILGSQAWGPLWFLFSLPGLMTAFLVINEGGEQKKDRFNPLQANLFPICVISMVWLLSCCSLIFLLPQKVSDHPFYLIGAVPVGSFLLALGWLRASEHWTFKVRTVILLCGALLAFRYFLPPAISPMTNQDRLIPNIGRSVDAQLPKSALLIAEQGISPELLYYTKRLGWTFDLDMQNREFEKQARFQNLLDQGYGDPVLWLKKLRKEGAEYLVISSLDALESSKEVQDFLSEHAKLIKGSKEEAFLLYQLS